MAAIDERTHTVPKFLLLKHYRGGPETHPNCAPMSEWSPAEISAHIAFQHEVCRVLQGARRVPRRAGGQPGGHLRALRRP